MPVGTVQEFLRGFEVMLQNHFHKVYRLQVIEGSVDDDMDMMANIVAAALGVDISLIKSKSRVSYVVTARMICMYMIRINHYSKFSLVEIANFFNKDHTTIMHAVRTIENFLFVKDPQIVNKLELCKKAFEKYKSDLNENSNKGTAGC